jgi:type II secretion system protein H
MSMNKRSRNPGFTLIEILMVVAVIALIAGMGGGIYLGTYKATIVKKAARDFELAAKYARMTAIERQQPCLIRLDVVNGAFLVTRQAAEADETDESETSEIILRDVWFRPVKFEGEVKFEAVQVATAGTDTSDTRDEPEGRRTIIFRPDGTAENAIVQIGDGKTHYTVAITAATGKTKVEFGTGEDIVFSTVDLDRQMY